MMKTNLLAAFTAITANCLTLKEHHEGKMLGLAKDKIVEGPGLSTPCDPITGVECGVGNLASGEVSLTAKEVEEILASFSDEDKEKI